ncbi:PWWP domain protein [Pseudohyphozyma bogoriensis]|nr:PWWP domain protein [Pseudohyphozyma bogoriensis]
MESTKSSQHASEKHVSRAATPSTITSDTPCGIESDDVGEITAGLGARLGRREKTPGPVQTGTIPHPSPSLQKKASTSLKRRTSPSPSPKRAPPPFIPPSIVALPSSSTAPGPAFNVGDGVMAKYERHGWWPSVVLDPETAPKGAGRVSGERTPTALLVKRLPQGGDWSFISPPNVRRLRPDERARAEHHLADLTSTKLGSQAKRYPREYLRGINLAQGDSSALLPYTIPYVRGSPASGPGTPLERALESKEVVEMRQRRELERAAKYQSKGEDQKKVIKRRSVEVIVID